MSAALLLPFFLLLWIPVAPGSEGDHRAGTDPSLNSTAALEEVNRVLTEEVKLAARPHTYLIVDLVANALILKGRGVELQRLPVSQWSAESRDSMVGTFRLLARPPVMRRKVNPASPEQEPIVLADMPTHYVLECKPLFILEVAPPADQAFFRWMLVQARSWGRWLRSWADSILSPATTSPQTPRLVLTLSEDSARSLAWALVDGMPLVIRRPG